MTIWNARARRPAAGVLTLMAAAALTAMPALAADKGATYDGRSVRVGHGTVHTFVRTDDSGKVVQIGIVVSEKALDGLPKATKKQDDFPYLLPMPAKGPRTVIDHAVLNWESQGHPPPHVYDVPHFDFHFYMVSRADQMRVKFKSEADSGSPTQQPPANLLPAGYIMPPGTAVPQMGAHAVNPAGGEFHGQPFTATFIYGYYDQKLTFVEPMASLAYLKTKPDFAAPVVRPETYSKPGTYPSAYSVKYDARHKAYVVALETLK